MIGNLLAGGEVFDEIISTLPRWLGMGIPDRIERTCKLPVTTATARAWRCPNGVTPGAVHDSLPAGWTVGSPCYHVERSKWLLSTPSIRARCLRDMA